MRIAKKLVFFVLVCFLVFSPICLANNEPVVTNIDENSENTKTDGSQATNILNTDLYIGNQDVVIEDAVNGNVFAMGSNVTVKGEIVGDLFVVANTLTIEENAVIYSNIFACTNNFVMKGIAYDIYAFTKTFELSDKGYIYRDIKLYSENVDLKGVIKKDAYIAANTITMPENAKNLIGGNLNYTSDSEFTIPEGAVLGEVKYTRAQNEATASEIISSYIINFLCSIIYAIAVILLATFYAPKFIEKANYALNKRPFVSAGIGILAFVLIPVISVVLLTLSVFSYVSFAILAIYGLILSITLAIFSMAIGKYIVNKMKNPSKGNFILFAILSAIVLWFLQIVPAIGGYVTIFIFVVGLGIFLFSFFMRKDVSEIDNKTKSSS